MLTPRIEAPGVLRNVPLDGPVERADLHLVPTEDGVWCLAVEVNPEEGRLGPAREDRDLEKQDILLHTIVHDLASPLSGIVGCLSAIEDGPENAEDLERLVALALRQAHRQERLIQQILDVFRAQDDDPAQEEAPLAPDVSRVAGRLVENLEPSFALQGVRLVIEDRSTDFDWARHPVIGEETRLERVLANLLDNGLRHAPADSTVTVRLDEGEHHVEVSVLDEGPGVPQEEVEGLFARLSQGQNRGRVGLGLYFCRITIQRWGGDVGYAPRDGGGARFWFRLPWAHEAEEEEERTPTTV